MKKINSYIQEKLVIGNNLTGYNYHPETKQELIDCINNKIKKEGLGTKDKPLDLNDIDTSKITDMSALFDAYDGYLKELSKNGYFDISDWDVSNVNTMMLMFRRSKFDNDISNWNVSRVKDMAGMFNSSAFTGKNGDISRWDVSSVKTMESMFSDSKFTGENSSISNWDVSSVRNMRWMFYRSSFTGDIKKWNVNNVDNMFWIFKDCPLEKNPPKWYKK